MNDMDNFVNAVLETALLVGCVLLLLFLASVVVVVLG